MQSSAASAGLLYGRCRKAASAVVRVRLAVLIDAARRYNRRRLRCPGYLGECRMNSKSLSRVALAAAAAVMFSTVAMTTASADDAKVKCSGVNSCKGQSACKSASNSCKGQNSCKGTGFKMMTQADCDAAKAKAKS